MEHTIFFPNNIWKIVTYYAKKHSIALVILFSFNIYLGIHPSVEAYIIKQILNEVAYGYPSIHPFLQGISPMLIFLWLRALWGISNASVDYMLLKTTPLIKKDIAESLTIKLANNPESFFNLQASGNLANIINNMQNSIKIILDNSRRIIKLFIEVIAGVFTVYFVHSYFSILLLVWTTTFLLSALLFSNKLQRVSAMFANATNVALANIVDIFLNSLSVRMYNTYAKEKTYIASYLEKAKNLDQKFRMQQIKYWTTLEIICSFMLSAIVFVFYKLSKTLNISSGDFALVVLIAIGISNTIYGILDQFEEFIGQLGVCKESLKIIKSTKHLENFEHGPITDKLAGEINFKNINFSYLNKQFVYKNLSVHIPKGQKVGLVGLSGSGKSTFLKLLLRFYDPNGEIFLSTI